MDENPKPPKRRWLSFSLRGILYLALIIAAYAAGRSNSISAEARLREQLEQQSAETEKWKDWHSELLNKGPPDFPYAPSLDLPFRHSDFGSNIPAGS